MTWGLSSYETRFRWIAAIWAVILTGFCFSALSWKIRVAGALLWVAITVLLSLRYAWWRPRGAREIPLFLLLGRTTPDGQSVWALDFDGLERLIRNLLAAGYRFQTLPEALAAPVRKSVVMTFDGGSREALDRLLPILRHWNARATLFVTDRGELDPRRVKPLEVQELARSGLVAFGGSVEPLAADATPEAWQAAIVRNRQWIAGVLGYLPEVFAYPEGVKPETLQPVVQAAGYRYAMTVGRILQPVAAAPFAIPRRPIPAKCKPWQAYLLATRGRFSALSTPKN